MDQDTAGHSFTLRKDAVLNGMIIAIEHGLPSPSARFRSRLLFVRQLEIG
jgi:hypothetical protein